MEPIRPPKNDEIIERQQFYATVAITIQTNDRAIQTIGGKLDDLATRYDRVHETVHASETRNKTLIKTAVIIWAVVGGAVGWYLERSIDKFEQFVDRVNLIEKKQSSDETDVAKIKDIADKVDSLKRINGEIQRQMDDLTLAKDNATLSNNSNNSPRRK